MRLREVRRPEEEDVDAIDGDVVLDRVHCLAGLDVHDDHRLAVGPLDVGIERLSQPPLRGARAGQAALAARSVLDRSDGLLDGGRRVDPWDVNAVGAAIEEAQDDVRLVRRDASDGGHTTQLERAAEVLDVAGLEHPVLTVEDQEVPAEHGDILGQRRLRVADEAAEDRLSGGQLGLGRVGQHLVPQSMRRLTTSSQRSDAHERAIAAATDAFARASAKPGECDRPAATELRNSYASISLRSS